MPSLQPLLFSTLLTLTSAADCLINKSGTHTYTITAPQPIPDISGVCGGLWDNLRGWTQCSASETSCGVIGQYNDLRWKFTVPSICNSGMVESVWWEATENAYGDLQCA